MTTTTTIVPDGAYYIHPEGGCWEHQVWRGGRCVGQTTEADMGTHIAARDQYAHCDPDLATEEVPETVARVIIGPRRHIECVVVMRVPD